MKNEAEEDVELQQISEECDLGITVDNELKFRTHIQNKVNKANAIMGAIRRSFLYLDEENFKYLFKSIVRPHLEYAACVWSPHLKKDQESFENVLRRASKRIMGMKDL